MAWGAVLSRTFEPLLNVLYPPRCLFCKERVFPPLTEYFCPRCRSKIQVVDHPLCLICGRTFPSPAGEDRHCGDCIEDPPPFFRARSWACYPKEEPEGHPLRQVLQQFKYGRKISLGKPLGRLFAESCYDSFRDLQPELLIPVPLHVSRLRWRGFNQSLILAREVSRLWAIPMDPFVLFRDKETSPQTQLPEKERRKNVRGAFRVNDQRSVKRMNILVVDDVYTSGATVSECAKTLLKAGAREVSVLTLARTV